MPLKTFMIIAVCLALFTSSVNARAPSCIQSQHITFKGSSATCNQKAVLEAAQKECTQRLLQQKVFTPSAVHCTAAGKCGKQVVDATVQSFQKSPASLKKMYASGSSCEFTADAICCLSQERKEAGAKTPGAQNGKNKNSFSTAFKNMFKQGGANKPGQAQGPKANHAPGKQNPRGANNKAGQPGHQGAKGQAPGANKPTANKPAQPGKQSKQQGHPATKPAGQKGAPNQKAGPVNKPHQPANKPKQPGAKQQKPVNKAPAGPKAVQTGPNTYNLAAAFKEPQANAGVPRASML